MLIAKIALPKPHCQNCVAKTALPKAHCQKLIAKTCFCQGRHTEGVMPRVTLVCSMWHHFTSCLTSASRMPKCNLCLWVAHTTIYRSIWSTHAHMSHRVCRTASIFMISSYPSLPHTTKVSRMYTVMIWICVVMACDPYSSTPCSELLCIYGMLPTGKSSSVFIPFTCSTAAK